MADHEKIATSLLVLKEYAKDPGRGVRYPDRRLE
jgi:hypothetical protein